MRKSIIGIVALYVLVAASTAGAQFLKVSYLDGQAEVRNGSAWTELSIGDAVPLAASIRLEPTAHLQLKGPSADLILTRPGTYSIRDIMAARRTVLSQGVGAALANSLRYLSAGSSSRRQSATMGVRGDGDRGASDEEGWVESTAAIFLEAGTEYIKSGQYDSALEQLGQARQLATDEETPEIRCYSGYAYALEGKTLEAWKQVDGLNPGRDEPWQGNFILLKARLLIDSSAYPEAASFLTNDGKELAQDPQRAPVYYFLLGLAYRGQGDSESSDQYFSRTVQISAQSDLGKCAAGLVRAQ